MHVLSTCMEYVPISVYDMDLTQEINRLVNDNTFCMTGAFYTHLISHRDRVNVLNFGQC